MCPKLNEYNSSLHFCVAMCTAIRAYRSPLGISNILLVKFLTCYQYIPFSHTNRKRCKT